MATLATHLVWTAYMTWPPGDPRGHWSPLFDLYGQITAQGGRLQLPDTTTRRVAAEKAREPAKILDASETTVVAAALGALVRPPLAPRTPDQEAMPACYAAAIEATHVHLLVGPVQEELSRCVGRMKGTSSSAVLALRPNQGRHRVWTGGYWKVFLFDMATVQAVKRYIDEHNVRRGLPAEPFAWITPLDRKSVV